MVYPGDRTKVSLFMYFDEAHCLADHQMTHASLNRITGRYELESRPALFAFLRALDQLRTENIFSLFLSTVSNVSFFAPTKELFRSARSSNIKFDLLPPITELPFDLCEAGNSLATENEHVLNEISTTKFLSQFGRPLCVTLYKLTLLILITEFQLCLAVCSQD
jgi:hypothetical protein